MATVVAVLFAAWLFGCGGSGSCDDYRFDRDAWFANDATEGDDSPRRAAAESLVRCGVLTDMTAPDVRNLLGKPWNTPGSKGTHPEVLQYPVGETEFEAILLAVYFDERGRVARATEEEG